MVILFWLFLAGIYGCFFLAFAGLWFWGRKKNITWLKWLGGIPASIMLFIAILLTVLIAFGIHETKKPEYVFKDAFGVEQPESVSNIQSSYYQFADTSITYIRFTTSEEEFTNLVSIHLQEKTAEEMKRETPGEAGAEPPVWWDYKVNSDWIYYLRVLSPFNEEKSRTNGYSKKGFFGETEIFAYNPKTHVAYYHFIGID